MSIPLQIRTNDPSIVRHRIIRSMCRTSRALRSDSLDIAAAPPAPSRPRSRRCCGKPPNSRYRTTHSRSIHDFHLPEMSCTGSPSRMNVFDSISKLPALSARQSGSATRLSKYARASRSRRMAQYQPHTERYNVSIYVGGSRRDFWSSRDVVGSDPCAFEIERRK